MTFRRSLHLSALVLCTLSVPALAHHSFTSFWQMNVDVVITGVVKSISLVNPHPYMEVEVTEADGTTSVWNITSTATGRAIIQNGWNQDTVPVGTTITIEGHPSRQEGVKALAAGTITLPDGRQYSFGGSLGVPIG